MSSNPSLADSISSGNSRKENVKRKKGRASPSHESEKSSGTWALLYNYGGIFCLVVTFFIAGITVGSLLVESSGSSNGDVNAFPQSLTKKMLHSIDASSVQSVVSIKGHHLRKAEEIPSVLPPAPPSPFRDSHSADGPSAVPSNHHPVPPSAAPPVEQQQQHQLRGLPNLFSSVSYGAGSANAAANAAAATAAEVVDDRRYSLHCQDEGYLILPNTATLDDAHVLIAAWVYLDASESHDNDMRTIFSNKEPGCEAGAEQHGLAVFVNAWQSSDHKVYLEYGGERSGCNKLDSGSVTLTHQRWYHVAVALTETHAAMFIDGALVNVQAVSDPHIVSDTASSLVGRYAASAPYTLYGNVSTLAFVHHVSATDEAMPQLTATVKQLQRLDTARHVPHLQALYSLQDAAYEKPNSIAVESSSATANAVRGTSKNGKYTFSSFGGGVAGVKIPLVTGVDEHRVVTDAMRQASDKQAYTRRERIKEGMRHAWRGYKQYAWGNDELKPLSNRGQDNWGGMGVTLVDSLDTLWLMGLHAEFKEARDWVATRLTFDRAGQVSVFETTIRELGGLLAAYDFSQDRVFLDKARQLGDRLIRAFSASPQTGIPSAMLNMRTGAPANGWAGATAILSELGSLQLEFRYLGYSLGDTSYETTSMKPLQVMVRKKPRDGLYPIKIHMNSGDFADSTVTFGALGDSFYEYLLKLWLQGGRKEMWLREAYDRAMNGAIERLLQASSPSGLAFFADWNGHSTMRKMDHLVCFVPGMLALGAYTDPLGLDSGRAQRDLAVAKAMMYTCREMYHRMQSGISAEYVEFPAGRDLVPGPGVDFYILRPETAESMFILHQLTGDPIYRDWAWEIFEAIEAHCKTSSGYASIRNVNSQHTGQDDRMESFFLAETMKYLYLAQDPDKPVDLMHMVFNTEAHPMRVFDANKHTPVPLN